MGNDFFLPGKYRIYPGIYQVEITEKINTHRIKSCIFELTIMERANKFQIFWQMTKLCKVIRRCIIFPV